MTVLLDKWEIRTSIQRLLFWGAIPEVTASLWLWEYGPTDSVRVWYPTIWSYVGEHYLPWCGIVALILILEPFGFQTSAHAGDGTLSFGIRAFAALGAGLFVADLTATSVLALTTYSRQQTFATQIWHTHSYLDYFRARAPIFLTTLVVTAPIINQAVRKELS